MNYHCLWYQKQLQSYSFSSSLDKQVSPSLFSEGIPVYIQVTQMLTFPLCFSGALVYCNLSTLNTILPRNTKMNIVCDLSAGCEILDVPNTQQHEEWTKRHEQIFTVSLY